MLTAALPPSSALSHGFDGFIAFLHDPQTGASTLSPKRFNDVLSINIQTLAAQAHVHRNTIHQAPASESVQKFLREALRLLRATTDLCGDVGRTIFWYRNEPLPPFGYQTAENWSRRVARTMCCATSSRLKRA